MEVIHFLTLFNPCMKSKTLVAKCNYLKWITLVHYKKIIKCWLLHPSAHLGEWKSEMTVYSDGCKSDILYNTSLSTKMAVQWLVSPWDQNENILWYFYVLWKVIFKVEWSWFDCTMNSHANSECIEPQFLVLDNSLFYGMNNTNSMDCKK